MGSNSIRCSLPSGNGLETIMRSRGHVPVVSAYEYGLIDLPVGLDTERIRERLKVAGEQTGLQAFETRGRRIYAQGVVGVIDAGEVIVEILPKTGNRALPSDDAAFLGDLLRFTGNDLDFGLNDAAVAIGDGGLLEVVLSWAARTVATHLRNGVPHRYTVREEISTAVRGRVELRHLVHQRPGKAFELTVRYAPLREDNPVSQIVRWLVAEVAGRTRSLRTRALCSQLLQALSHITEIVPTCAHVDALILNPLEDHWRPVVALARCFIAQGVPDPTRGGRLVAVAVLFTLHDLFEAALRRVFSEGIRSRGLALRRATTHLLSQSGSQSGFVSLRPDFCFGLKAEAAPKIVGDAKWKRIFDGPGLPRVRENDLYQIVSYAAALQSEVAFIICPLLDSESDTFRRSAFTISGLNRPLDVLGIRLSLLIAENHKGRELRGRLCEAIVGMLPTTSLAS
jgi:5-methylcytosine-specific restriction endonuclease McrBC regulatory subunit McrC